MLLSRPLLIASAADFEARGEIPVKGGYRAVDNGASARATLMRVLLMLFVNSNLPVHVRLSTPQRIVLCGREVGVAGA